MDDFSKIVAHAKEVNRAFGDGVGDFKVLFLSAVVIIDQQGCSVAAPERGVGVVGPAEALHRDFTVGGSHDAEEGVAVDVREFAGRGIQQIILFTVLQCREDLSADCAVVEVIVIGVTGGVEHGVCNLVGHGCVGEVASAKLTFPVFHIAIDDAGFLLGRVVDAVAVAEGDGAFLVGTRVGETAASHSVLAVDDDFALGIDLLVRTELRIVVRS